MVNLQRECKKRKKVKKNSMFYMKNCKKEQFCYVLLLFFAFLGLANPFGKAPGACTIHSA